MTGTLLRHLENGSEVPLVESSDIPDDYTLSGNQEIFTEYYLLSYRRQRTIIESVTPGDQVSKLATLQAKKMLNMQGPLVMCPDLKDIKDLAIKTWNSNFQQRLSALSKAVSENMTAARAQAYEMLGVKYPKKLSESAALRIRDIGVKRGFRQLKNEGMNFQILSLLAENKKYVMIRSRDNNFEVYGE